MLKITFANANGIIGKLDCLIQFLANAADSSHAVFKHGAGLQYMQEFLTIVFSGSSDDFQQRVNRCYKVYIEPEPPKQTRGAQMNDSGWIKTKANIATNTKAKIISFWCFSPGFGLVFLISHFEDGKNRNSFALFVIECNI